MKQAIDIFLNHKNASTNTLVAYYYDLHQFMAICEDKPIEVALAKYQTELQSLAVSARRRKLSVVNQFLYFLYQQKMLEQYYRLEIPKSRPTETIYSLEDTSCLMDETVLKEGQLIAVLVAFMGLLPKEIAQLRWTAIDREFQVLTIEVAGQRRVLHIPTQVLRFLPIESEGVYLFDKNGKSYSRQWFYTQLSNYLTSIGHSDWTAQSLREQYILSALQSGRDVGDICRQLGLKTRIGIEKYKAWISS